MYQAGARANRTFAQLLEEGSLCTGLAEGAIHGHRQVNNRKLFLFYLPSCALLNSKIPSSIVLVYQRWYTFAGYTMKFTMKVIRSNPDQVPPSPRTLTRKSGPELIPERFRKLPRGGSGRLARERRL